MFGRQFRERRNLLLLVAALSLTLSFVSGHIALSLRFGIGVFHRLAVFLGAFGTDFGPLLPLLVEHLLAAQQFDERLFGAVALSPRRTNDAQISALAIAEPRSHGV